MNVSRLRFSSFAAGSAVLAVGVAVATSGAPSTVGAAVPRNHSYVEHMKDSQGGASREGEEARIAAEQYAFARTAPSGITAPGAYDAAWAQMTSLPTAPGTWSEV